MPPDTPSNVYEARGRWFVRVSLGGGKRLARLLEHAKTQAEAEERGRVIAKLVSDLRSVAEADETLREAIENNVKKTVTEAAAASDTVLAVIVEGVRGFCAGRGVKLKHLPPAKGAQRFRDVAKAWTSGALAKRFPDYVKTKRTAKGDAYTFDVVNEADAGGGVKFGDLFLAEIRIEHVDAVMATLPANLQPATRRQYVQAIRKLLSYGVHPLRQIDRNPIVREHMPKARRSLAKGQLRPAEEARLCGATKAPILDRMVLAFCHREGPRLSEAVGLEWSDVDLNLGVVTLDENKTDDPRAWDLGADVVRALERWRKRNPEARWVFQAADGKPHNVEKLAARFREYLGADYAKIDRPELLERTASRIPLRAHDTRGAFITHALACGRTEAWVTDRTGHKSSQMVYGYKQAARTAAAIGLGWWAPMDEAIPEVAAEVAAAPERPDEGSGAKSAESDQKPKWRNRQTPPIQNGERAYRGAGNAERNGPGLSGRSGLGCPRRCLAAG